MLDPKWNVMTIIPTAREDIRSTQEELLNYGYIYHFTGYKPWQHECTHPARHQWRRYLDESLWFDPGERKDPIGCDQAGPAT
jgi:lipopolysaccharide biosynthesis glycosyltransferase